MSRLKTFRKKIFKNPISQKFIGLILAGYVKLVYETARVHIINGHEADSFWSADKTKRKPFILTIWHSHLVFAKMGWQDSRPAYGLMSQSGDGRILSVVCRIMGLRFILGSTSKGAVSALKQMIRLARKGESFIITPDGPRGPNQVFQPGAVEVARLSGIPIIPAAFASTQGWQFNTWDKFTLPGLFNDVVVVYGEPVYVSKSDDIDQTCQHLQQTMARLHERAKAHAATFKNYRDHDKKKSDK